MPPALQRKPTPTPELQPNEELVGLKVRVEADNSAPDEAAFAAQIRKARLAAQRSVGHQDQPLIKVEAKFDVSANVPTSSTDEPEGSAAPTEAAPIAAPETPTAPETPAALPPQTTLPGGGAPGGQTPQAGGAAAGEKGEGKEGGKEGKDKNEEEKEKGGDEGEGDEGDEGGDEDKGDDKEGGDEGEGGSDMGNPEEAFVFGSRASLTASFEELPTLLTGNLWPLIYIHMHFIGYFLLPDIPFLAMIPYLQTKLKFEKPNILQTVGFVILVLAEMLSVAVIGAMIALPLMMMYAIYSVLTLDWDVMTQLFQFLSGFTVLKMLFGLIRNMF